MRYFVRFSEDHFLVREGDGPEVEWGDRDCYGVSATIHSIHRSEQRGMDVLMIDTERYGEMVYGADDVSAGSTAYVVLVHYEDGDTFGYDGYWTIAAVKASLEDAAEIERRCENPNDRATRSDGGRESWWLRPWDGYFAGLTSVEVLELVMQP